MLFTAIKTADSKVAETFLTTKLFPGTDNFTSTVLLVFDLELLHFKKTSVFIMELQY
jgi:hypothetical protein